MSWVCRVGIRQFQESASDLQTQKGRPKSPLTTKLLNSNGTDLCGPCASRTEVMHRFCVRGYPVEISEHENLGPRKCSTVRTGRQIAQKTTVNLVDKRLECARRPHRIGTGFRALHHVNRAVACRYEFLTKSSLLKLAVDIAREDCRASRHIFSPATKQLKTRVGRGMPIDLKSVAIEPPAKLRWNVNR
jgi:hypothetical protein